MSKPDVSHIGGARRVPGRPGRLRRRARPGRTAGPLADGDVAAHLPVRGGQPVRLHHHGACRCSSRCSIGGAIGLGVRYAAGVDTDASHRRGDRRGAGSAGCPVSEMRRVLQTGGATESRRYASVALGGGRLDVFVYDWDQQAAGLLYRLYRLVRLQRQVSRGAPLSQDRAVERLALLSYAAQDAGVPMPRLRALVRSGQEAVVLAYEHHDGPTLADLVPRRPTPSSAGSGTTCSGCTRTGSPTGRSPPTTSCSTAGDQVLLLPPNSGDVAATDLQIRLDRAQLMAELALLVGPDRSADLALAKIPDRRDHQYRAAAADGGAGPVHQARAAPPPGRAARAAQAAAHPRPRRRGRAGQPRAHPAAHPGDADRERGGGVPARGRACQGQPVPPSCGTRTGAGVSRHWACRR